MEMSSDGGISFSSMRQPSLVDQLKVILSEYPDGGQILKELIQNAEDAEATEVHFLYDRRRINNTSRDAEHRFNKFFKGPALCVFNEAVFSEKDWEGIQRIYGSEKKEDRLKVGRFGLGFKSVFHLTDNPCVISGDRLLMIDPHQSAGKEIAVVQLSRIGRLESAGLTADAFWAALDGTFGMKRESLVDGYFEGTIFWFPLRQKPSELSETLYQEAKIVDLFQGFESEAPCILVFLKHLERITVSTRQHTDKISDMIRVEISNDADTVKQSRLGFKEKLIGIDANYNGDDIKNEMCMTVATTVNGHTQKHDWLVVNYFVGNTASENFQKLIQDKSLGYSPYVGVAAPLSTFKDDFEGHVFCFLPLPREGLKLTGLPVHVNGFFSLSQNRHHLKWETDEQKGKHIDAKEILWNMSLIKEALPKAYEVLIQTLIANSVFHDNTTEMVALVYSCLPIFSNVQNKWSVLEKELYARILASPLFYCKNKNKWISLPEATFATFKNIPHDQSDIKTSVEICLYELEKSYVVIPSELVNTLKQHSSQIKDLCPQLLSSYLHKNHAYRRVSSEHKLGILMFLLSDYHYENINCLELLPLSSGKWIEFNKLGDTVFSCSKQVLEMLPSQEDKLLMNLSLLEKPLADHFKWLCSSGLTQLREMKASNLVELLDNTIQRQLGTSSKLLMTKSSNLTKQWLQSVWHYITRYGDVASFIKLQILPILREGTWENPQRINLVRLSDVLLVRTNNEDTISDGVCRCFEAMGVSILEDLPPWISENLISKYCFWPTSKSVIALLSKLCSYDDVKLRIATLNQDCSWDDKVEMRKFLERSQFEMTKEAVYVIKELQIFSAVICLKEDGFACSVSQIPRFITVTENFPGKLNLPFTCLRAENTSLEFLLKGLGAKKVGIEELVSEKLKLLENKSANKSREIGIFMEYFIRNFHLFRNNISVVRLARGLHFLKTGSNSHLYSAEEMFDPSDKLLFDLLERESLLPEQSSWGREEDLVVLRYLGMKKIKDVDVDVALQVAQSLDMWSKEGKEENTLKRKSAALISLLSLRPELLENICKNGKSLVDCIKFLSCIQVQDKLPTYPYCLHWYSHQSTLCKPSEAKDISLCTIIGAVLPTVVCDSEYLINAFQWKEPPELMYVFNQLQVVKDCYSVRYSSELLPVIKTIYEHLHKREDEIVKYSSELTGKKIIWTGEDFVFANRMIMQNNEYSLDLRPYFFSLPEEYSQFHSLFTMLGCLQLQDVSLYLQTLHCIKAAHCELQSEQTVRRDRNLVCILLERIAGLVIEGSLSVDDLDILIMVQDVNPNKVVLLPPSECTFDDDPVCPYDDNDGFSLVHEMITLKIAEALGVKSITKRAALDGEELGVEEWGQTEQLTTRLHRLLSDGYTDGLSVPKELIQNADDAGASTVKFLYDERKNLQMRERLLNKGMKGYQGPSLWVYNDAKFTTEDLKNITKLNAGTKQRDTKKIGKFGLGFCSVYNLTDLPSFVTGSSMVFFDPHEKHLGNVLRSRGTGLKYKLPNKNLVTRHIDQFRPYHNVFGCKITDSTFSEYSGTLFRLPLRTADQARESKICQIAYTHDEIIKLLRMFIDAAGNMLIFSQSINSIEIYHLKEKAEPSQAVLLFEIHKGTLKWENHVYRPVTTSVLSRASDCLKENTRLLEIHKTIICETLKSTCKSLIHFLDDVAETSVTVWMISWATGRKNSLTVSRSMSLDHAVPLSAVAIPCKSAYSGTPLALSEIASGFYKNGHLFCFLPLPLPTGLNIHINGCFSVTSDRRQLISLTEDEKENEKAKWNGILLEDASVTAFVHMLQALTEKAMNVDQTYRYYDLWPSFSSKEIISFTSAFYRHVIMSDAKVFYGNELWITFQDVAFLDPMICERSYGDLAFEFLSHIVPRPKKIVIEMPGHILEKMRQSNTDKLDVIQSATITEKEFFLIFLRNVHDDFWAGRLKNRNTLIAAAINLPDHDVRKEIQCTNCIPTDPDQNLCSPRELIHPKSRVSTLFSVADQRFPINTPEFHSDAVLKTLVDLGMNDYILPAGLLMERCKSIPQIAESCILCCRARCFSVVEYLCNEDVLSQLETDIETLSNITEVSMFPVLLKPKTWKFSWGAETENASLVFFNHCKHCEIHSTQEEVLLLEKPKNLYREALSDYIGSVRCLIDESVFRTTKSRWINFESLFHYLSVKGVDDISLQSLINQMCILSKEYSGNPVQFDELRRIQGKIFKQLEYHITYQTKSEMSLECLSCLHDIPVVLINNELVKIERVVFQLKEEYKPLLYRLPSIDSLRFKTIYKHLGVKEHFDISDILSLMNSLKEDWQPDKTSVECIAALLRNLKDIMDKTDTNYDTLSEFHDLIYAPDTDCQICPTYKLAIENSNFASTVAIRTLHKDIPPSVGEALGVKTKELKCFKNISTGISFGQREKLITRIKGLLKSYPCDASIMKELLQNADDSGATEINFVKDYRNHATDCLFSKSCEPLQGPSLCVYNNSYFTKEDLEGIHDLGKGSKSDDPNKTGQYGVGFNAVYHLTDTPAFVSKGPVDSDSYLLILDPLCNHVPEANEYEPGQLCKLGNVESNFPNHLLGFSIGTLITEEVGTVFRFPLRSKESDIGSKEIDKDQMDSILKTFRDEMPEAVLFLKNIKCIKITDISTGDLKEEYTVTVQLSDEFSTKRKQFHDTVNAITKENMDTKERNLESGPCEVLYPITVTDSNARSVEWLIVQQFGPKTFRSARDELKQRFEDNDLGLLPLGGVAIRLNDSALAGKVMKSHGSNQTFHLDQKSPAVSKEDKSSNLKTYNMTKSIMVDHKCYRANNFNGKLFCFLPLPVFTGLPVHVNGHFSLDHESRRELWKEGYRMDWNFFIFESVIVPSWISGLLYLRNKVKTVIEKTKQWYKVNEALKQHSGYFPEHRNARSTVWKKVISFFYEQVFTDEVPIFAYVHDLESEISIKPTEISTSLGARFCLQWTHLTSSSSQKLAGVFNDVTRFLPPCIPPLEREKQSRLIGSLLKSFGMKLLETPMMVVDEFQSSGITSVPTSSPELVISFLKDSCCKVGSISVDISKSKFQTKDNLSAFLSFISADNEFASKLENLPVLLTEDGIFRKFCKENPVYITIFSKLLPKSAHLFLHDALMLFFSDEKVFETDVCRKFRFENFMQHLPLSVDGSMYSISMDIQWKKGESEFQSVVSEEWLCLLFTFLYNQSQREDKLNKSGDRLLDTVATQMKPSKLDIKEFRSKLCQIQQWSFLPCIKNKKRVLIPVRETCHLLYLRKAEKADALGSALHNLCLPTLDMKVFSNSLKKYLLKKTMVQMVSTLDTPYELLECIVHHRGMISEFTSITVEEATEIMTYFGKKLPVLIENRYEQMVARKISELPFFITLQGTFTSLDNVDDVLVIPRDIPVHGIQQWADRCRTVLLQENDSFGAIFKFLRLQNGNIEYIYGEKILPEINKMPQKYWIEHIVFLRDRLGYSLSDTPAKTKIAQKLKNIKFVNAGGKMNRVCELFDPENEVFKCMKEESEFPPMDFRTDEWLHFLIQLGLICDVSDTMIVAFAHQIELDGNTRLTDAVFKKSEIILERFLINSGTEWKSATLDRIKTFRFIKRYDVNEQQSEIWPQDPKRLICFQDSIPSLNASLCWTCTDLLPEKTFLRLDENVRKNLGVQDKPPLEKVILHCQNICSVLKMKKKHFSLEFVEYQMTDLYEYLSDHLHSKSVMQRRLRYTPIIHLPEENDLVMADEVIIDLPWYSEIKPYLYQAPKYYGKYHTLFQSLGSKRELEFSHYARILNKIRDKCVDSTMLISERRIIQKAVKGLLRLDTDKDRSTLEIQYLYLPNEKLDLLKSTELTVADNYWFDKRIGHQAEIEYFAGLSFLECSDRSFSLKDVFLKWPAHLKPVLLSEVVEETVCLEIKEQYIKSQKALTIERFLHSEVFKASLCGILQQQYQREVRPCEDTFFSDTASILDSITVYELPELQTVLRYRGKVIAGTEISIPHHHKIGSGDQSNEITFFFTSTNEEDESDLSMLSDGFLSLICACVPSLRSETTSQVLALLQCINVPEKLPNILKRFQIKPFNPSKAVQRDYFPEPGTRVEIQLIPFLEQEIEPFKDYEYNDVAMDLNDTDEDESPVYIYVRILRECSPSNISGDLGKVYEVKTGNSVSINCTEQVSIIRLYRFVRKVDDPGTDIQIYDAEPIDLKPFDEHCDRIKSNLIDAWKLEDADRKRLKRRLLLKWHPDRNRGNEEYCKRVFQFIKDMIDRLEKDNEMAQNVDNEMARGPSNTSPSTSAYYDNINRKAQTYAQAFYNNYKEYCQYEHTIAKRTPAPDIGEAKRWMQQAKCDLKVAVTMFSEASNVDANNWICYLCHQASEKALKAVRYSKDANDVPRGSRSHYLTSLTSDSSIREQTVLLESRLGDHARLRYPDAVSRPKIPSQLYSKDDAEFTIDVTHKIIGLVEDDIS